MTNTDTAYRLIGDVAQGSIAVELETKWTIEQARAFVAELAEKEGEIQFAREVRAGCWDHRNDVVLTMKDGGFTPRELNPRNI